MAETAFQTRYTAEAIAAFEVEQSLVRNTVTTEANINGNTCTFLVAGSGGASAVTRGVNGLIPPRADDNTQLSATLAEWHDLVQKTGFNVYASQGNQRAIMQRTTMGVINRKIDSDIITALSTGTQYAGLASESMSLSLAMKGLGILGNNDVPMDGNISCLITPAAWTKLMQTKEFTSVDYVNNKPFSSQLTMFRWAGVNWIVHPNLTGVGTSTEYCIMYHKNAIGHAADMSTFRTPVGYDEEQDYSWARASIYMGSKLLQNSGVVIIRHDGSDVAATA